MRFIPDEFSPVAVVGAGTMGSDIAIQFARFGHEVRVVDPDLDALMSAAQGWGRDLTRLDGMGVLPAGAQDVRSRLASGDNLEAAVGRVELVVEAVTEDVDRKHAVIAEITEAAPSNALIGTNASTLTVEEIAEGAGHAERIVGTQFFTPPEMAPLVEVVAGPATARDAVERAVAAARGVGLSPIEVGTDAPGGIATRLAAIMFLAALDRHSGHPGGMDVAFRRLGFPRGPFELMDRIGLGAVSGILFDLHGRVPEPLQARVEAGEVGVKAGRGFFRYTSSGARRPDEPPPPPADAWTVIGYAVDEAARMEHRGLASAATIDRAARLALGFPGGPLTMAMHHGMARAIKAHRTGKGTPSDPFLAAESDPWYDAPPPPHLITRRDGLARLQLTAGNAGNALNADSAKALEQALHALEGAELVLLDAEGWTFMHPQADEVPERILEAIAELPVAALVHGPIGPAAAQVAEASRAVLVRTDTGLELDGDARTSLQLVDDGFATAVAHPHVWLDGVEAVASEIAGVSRADVEALFSA